MEGANRFPDVPSVLLVESAKDDRAMYAEYLRLFGLHTIEIGDTGDADALGMTAHVIVTGLRVPGPFDGIELVRRLRGDARTKDKPIVVLTACDSRANREAAARAGCDVFLSKPCLPDTLLAEICRVLRWPGGLRRPWRRDARVLRKRG